MGRLVDDILHIHDFAFAVPEAVADYVPGSLQLLQGGAYAVRALFADFRKAPGGVVPILRQGQHHGEQPFGFQRQPRISQVVVGHHRVVAGFFNAKYRHGITSFRRSEKCCFSGKDGLYAARTPWRGKPMDRGHSADCRSRNMEFSTPFVVISRIEKRHRPKPMACSGRVIQVSCLLSKMMGNGIIK